MQHVAWRLTICGIASLLGRKLHRCRASVLFFIYSILGMRKDGVRHTKKKSYEVISARKNEWRTVNEAKMKSEVYFMSLLFLKFLNTY